MTAYGFFNFLFHGSWDFYKFDLKGLSDEIETNHRWHGLVDLYLERYCWGLLNLVASSVFQLN